MATSSRGDNEKGNKGGDGAALSLSQGKMFLTVSRAKAAEQTLLTKVCRTWKFHPARSQSKYQRRSKEEICRSVFRIAPGKGGTQLGPCQRGESRRLICWHLDEHHPCCPLRSTPAAGKRSQSLGDHHCVSATIESCRLHVEKWKNLNLLLLHTLGSPKHTMFLLAHRWGSEQLTRLLQVSFAATHTCTYCREHICHLSSNLSMDQSLLYFV